MSAEKIKFWMALSEINTILTIISLEHPEYADRISNVKRELTEHINEGLRLAKELKKVEIDSWYSRNN